jgi:hypothetical protein
MITVLVPGALRGAAAGGAGSPECRTVSGLRTPGGDGTEIQVLPSVAGG